MNYHDRPAHTVHGIFNHTPIGARQWTVFLICFAVTTIEGFDTTITGFIAPAITQQWQLPGVALAPLIGVGLAGILIGSIVGGTLADRLGRKVVGAIAIAWFGAASVASSDAQALSQLISWRFVTGVGVGAAMPVMSALVAEYCSDRARPVMLATTFCGFLFGAASAGFATAWMIGMLGWRGMLALSGALPLVVLVAFVWRVPESPLHMLVRKQPRAVIEQAMAKIFPALDCSNLEYVADVPAAATSPGFALLGREYRLGTLLTWAAEFCGYLVFFLIGSWLPTHLKQGGLSIHAASQLSSMFQFGALGGAVLFAWMVRRFNVAAVVGSAFGIGVLLVIALGLLEAAAWYAGVVFLAGFAIGGPLICINTIPGVFYPTALRASGGGWTLAIGRLGSIVGSALIGLIVTSRWPFPVVCMFLGVPLLIGSLSMVWMRPILGDNTYRFAPDLPGHTASEGSGQRPATNGSLH